MCEQCLQIFVYPEYVDWISRLITMSGIIHGASLEAIHENVNLFRMSRCAFYVPPTVKDLLLRIEREDRIIFDWRIN